MKDIFILIWVYHGLIQEPEIFESRKKAELRKKQIQMKGFNPDYEEIDVFKKVVQR
ncbi:MAG: hypothetical protein WCP32_14090 [Bacteroidota bacterium]